MNFDIKYATYLQIFNFIKIKQGLGTILGTLDWRHLTEPLNSPGYTLGILIKPADRRGPPASDKEEKKESAGPYSVVYH